MSLEKVQQALFTAFVGAFPSWLAARVAWPNKAFTPPAGQSWMAIHFMPASEQVNTLGTDGTDLVEGLLQVTLNIPIGIGESDSRETIGALRACYKPQTLQYDGQPVSILSRSSNSSQTRDNFYATPFTVKWRATLSR